MRKLIEMNNPNMIMCDNPKCDYIVANPTNDPNADISMYINKPCPKCGENLLTQKDYDDSIKLLRGINWLNKWFSWLTFLSPKSKDVSTFAHVHNGIHIEKRVNKPSNF